MTAPFIFHDPAHWQGCRRMPERVGFESGLGTRAALRVVDYQLYQDWPWYAVPSQQQYAPSCVAEASVNWLELMLRRYVGPDAIPDGYQLDAIPAYHDAREHDWPGEPLDGGGLYLHQAFAAMERLGYVPPGAPLLRISTWEGAALQLHKTPLLQANQVSDGWASPNPATGEIGAKWTPLPWDGGHATLCINLLRQDTKMYVLFQNSWGNGWGYHGLGMLADRAWNKCALDDLLTLDLPMGWESWEGWKKYLIKGGTA